MGLEERRFDMAAGTQTQPASTTLDQLLAIKAIGGSEGPQWSPDGRSLTFVSGLAGTSELWSVDIDSGTLERLTVGMGGVGHLATFIPRWSPTGEYVAFVTAKSGVDEVWLWPVDGGEIFQLSRLGGRIEALNWAPDGRSIAVASNAFGQFDIFLVSVPDGGHTRLTSDPRYDVYPAYTPDGGHVLYVRLNDDWTDHEVIRIGVDGSSPEVILTDSDFFDYHYGRTFGYPTISPDGSTFLFRSHRSGWINVWAAATDGSGSARQIAPADADQGDAVWSPDGASIAYVENHNGTLDLRVVPAAGGEPRVLVAPEMGVVAEPAWSPDGTSIAYLRGDVHAPNDLCIVDVASSEQRQLTRSMLGGRVREQLVTPEKISYPTWDGRAINAYLYRPAQREPGQRFPGLLWIHGGPTAQFSDTWQPQVQYFVSRGYVVLLPNVRGSSGYGREFEDLNNGDWGHGDLRDVVAGVDYLKTLDDVDPDNFGITGTSYGGIMSMAAVAWAEPGVFKAAIPCSGYGDFLHMANEQELRHIKLMDFEFGKLPEAEAVYRHCSPIFDLAGATTPCFVLHGEGRYPGSTAGKDFALALEWNYKPFWYKSYPGETYYVAGTANVKRMLQDMLAFFDLYLKGIPHTLPDDGTRPLTHLSGLIPEKLHTGNVRFPVSGDGTPPKDMAN
jgi:dipeptidyl aminopeptidase/acylaminoacyl peptidase